jgi:hypothetical protein
VKLTLSTPFAFIRFQALFVSDRDVIRLLVCSSIPKNLRNDTKIMKLSGQRPLRHWPPLLVRGSEAYDLFTGSCKHRQMRSSVWRMSWRHFKPLETRCCGFSLLTKEKWRKSYIEAQLTNWSSTPKPSGSVPMLVAPARWMLSICKAWIYVNYYWICYLKFLKSYAGTRG